MRLWTVVVIATLLLGFHPREGLGAPGGEVAAERALLPPGRGVADLHSLWRERREALLRQDLPRARHAEAEIASLQRELDLPELHLLAFAAVKESQRLETSSPLEAEGRARLAVKLAPSLPEAHFQRLRTRFAADPLDLMGMAAIAADLFHTLGTHPAASRLLLRDLGVCLAWALGIVGTILLVGWSLRHGRGAIHEAHHGLRPLLGRGQTRLLLFGLLLLPLSLGLGPVFSAILLAAALGAWLPSVKRVVLWLWLLVMALLPAAVGAGASVVTWDGTTASALYRLEREGDLDTTELDGREPEVLFARARAEKRLGRLDEARRLYQEALVQSPRWGRVLVNLGNIDFLEGHRESAERRWATAIGLDPSLAPAYFNLSRLHYEKGDIFAGQEARRLALELAPELLERYTDENGLHSQANRYLVDATLGPRHWERFTTPPGIDLEEDLGRRLFGKAGAPWALAALFCVPLVWWRMSRRVLPHGCRRCGRTICMRCSGTTPGPLCLPCENLFVKRVTIDAVARETKEKEIKAHTLARRIGGRVAVFLLAGPAIGGRLALGLPLLFVGWFSVVWIFAPRGVGGIDELLPPGVRFLLMSPILFTLAVVNLRQRRND